MTRSTPRRVAPNIDAGIVQNSNILDLKVGSRDGKPNPTGLAKAEAALKALQILGSGWIKFELDTLCVAYSGLKAANAGDAHFAKLAVPAAELRAHAAVYEYPIVARMAGSLLALLKCEARASPQALQLIDAHIEAIKACVREEIRDLDHAAGRALADTLERKSKLICDRR